MQEEIGPGAIAALRWIDASATIDIHLGPPLAILAGIALVRGLRRGRTVAQLGAREETTLLAIVILIALGLRLIALDAPQQPRFYFSESTVQVAGRMLDDAGFLASVRRLATNTQVAWAQESPVLFGVHAAFQHLLGPFAGLPGVVGAAWGVTTSLLAWAAGRAIVSPGFGLAFAALVTIAPLQVTWARIGGLQIPAVTHTLLVVWVAFAAGRRRSLLLSVLSGLLAFASLWHYFPARIAPLLGAVALVSGLTRGPGRLGRRGWLCAPLAGLACEAAAWAAYHAGDFTLWPRYPGYLGTRGEATMLAALEGAWETVVRELPHTLSRYFWTARAADPRALWGLPAAPVGGGLDPGLLHGGLVLLPIALLGVLGMLACLRHPWRNAIWLLLAAGGLLLPALSTPSARRFVLLDLA
ncbi:MAG: hypothetical protein KIT14_00920 [bacterium]|nr:hypothetical protein [bacterium]